MDTGPSSVHGAPGAKRSDGTDYPTGRPAMRHGLLIRNRYVAAALATVDVLLTPLTWRTVPIPVMPRRILLCNWAHLGDVLLTLPAIAWLREEYPEAELGLLAGSWAAPLLDDIKEQFSYIHYIDHYNLGRSPRLSDRLARHVKMARSALPDIRALNYDLAIDFYPFFPGAGFTLWRAGIPARVGWTSGGLGAFYTHRVRRHDEDRHVIDYQREILARVRTGRRPEPGSLSPTYFRNRPRGPLPPPLDDGSPYMLIHPGTRQPTREWLDEGWMELARRLRVDSKRVVLIGAGEREQARNRAISAAVPGVVDLTNAFDWAGLVDVIAGCEALFCLESVAGHVAAVFDRPVTVVFGGMTNPRQWAPMTDKAVTVTFPTPCAPCNRWGCDRMDCIGEVGVDQVMQAAARVMQESGRRGTASSLDAHRRAGPALA